MAGGGTQGGNLDRKGAWRFGWGLSPRLTAGFALAVLAVVVGAAVSASAFAERQASSELVERTLESLRALEALADVVDAADLEQRGFLLGGDKAHLDRFQRASDGLESAIRRLRAALGNEGPESEDLARLEALARQKIGRLEVSLRIARERGLAAGRRVIDDEESFHLTERIHARVDEIGSRQQRLLDERQARWTQAVHVSQAVFAVADVVLLVLIVNAALLVRREIRDREERARERAEALALQEQLMGIVGHDLRTPLSAIVTGARVLSRAADVPDGRRAAAQRILSSAHRMEGIIRDILDFTRARVGGGLLVAPRSADLAAVCRDAVEEVTAEHPDRAVEVESRGDTTGEWDPDRIEQAVSNLLANAVRYSPPETPVLLRVAGDTESVAVEIHNQGPPIPTQLLPHLFEPYRRGTELGAERRSVGLGLYIVHTIARAHGGTVEVRSSAEEGTTFLLKLPRAGRTPAPGARGP